MVTVEGWRRWIRAIGWLVGAGLLGVPVNWAIEVEAVLDRTSVEVGESVVMQVIVRGTQDGQQRPQVPATPGLALRYAGPMSQMQNINGQTTVQVAHRYLLQPEAVGEIRIPPITVRVGRETKATLPLTLQVLPAEAHDEPAWLKLVVDRDEVVVGDTFGIELQLYFQSIREPTAPRFELDGFVVGRSPSPRQAATTRGGQQWSVVTWRFSVSATKPGDLSIGPVELDVTLVQGTPLGRMGSIFDDVFGPPRQAKRVTLKSRAHPIRALAPPAVGRPAEFAGAVGRFRASALVSPTEVLVGDPATVRVTVQGEGGIERLELPAWGETAGFRVYPGTNGFTPTDPLGMSGTKVFEYIIVPERPGILRMPVPPLVAFDPEARRYNPVPMNEAILMVHPSKDKSGTNPVVTAASGATTSSKGSPLTEWRPVSGLKPVLGGQWGHRAWIAGALAFPWVLWCGFAMLDGHRRRMAARPKQSEREHWRVEARRLARRVGSGEADPAEASRAVRYRLGAWLDARPEAITSGIVDAELRSREVGPELCADLESWFEEWETIRFAPGTGSDTRRFVERTRELLGRLEGLEDCS